MTNVAILGFGVVGSGTAEVITRTQTRNNHRQQNINLKYILDLREHKDSPYQGKFVQDFSVILQDPQVTVLVECIGGVKAAYDMTKQALSAGKSVVSSNKELVATHGYELLELAKANHCNYLFEASVGGGIPILRPLNTCLLANHIVEIAGILNGTTNFILSQMIQEGSSFQDALTEAQALGYAEQDPTADVDGHDACRKICILGNIAYGNQINPQAVPTQGIRSISPEDIQYAKNLDCSVKLLGRVRQEENNALSIFVAPHLVYCDSPLSHIQDVNNGVAVTGDSVDETLFYGKGAGALPTASAVVADVIDLSQNPSTYRQNGWGNEAVTLVPEGEIQSSYFVRLAFSQKTQSPQENMEALERDFALSGFGETCFPLYSTPDDPSAQEMGFITMFPTSKNYLQTALKEYEILQILPVYGFPPVDSLDLEEQD